MLVALVLAAGLLDAAAGPVRVRWLDLGGQGQDTDLTISESWPLTHFTRHMPTWHPWTSDQVRLPDGRIAYTGGHPTAKDTLFWQPLKALAHVESLGSIGGVRAYQIAYSRTYQVIVWDRGTWAFVPAVIIAGDESIIVGIHSGRVFQVEGRDVLHVRIQIEGTGHFQKSLFFTTMDGDLVLLEEDPSSVERVRQFLASRNLRLHHRGLGFCKDTLTEEQLFEGPMSDGYCRPCWFTIHHAIEGTKLVVRDISLVGQDCRIFPSWEDPPTRRRPSGAAGK